MKRDVIIKYNIFTNIERKKKPTEIIYCDKKKNMKTNQPMIIIGISVERETERKRNLHTA